MKLGPRLKTNGLTRPTTKTGFLPAREAIICGYSGKTPGGLIIKLAGEPRCEPDLLAAPNWIQRNA